MSALVRSDIAMPRNGRSIAVFQTLYAFLIVPPRSQIEDFAGLKDRSWRSRPATPPTKSSLIWCSIRAVSRAHPFAVS